MDETHLVPPSFCGQSRVVQALELATTSSFVYRSQLALRLAGGLRNEDVFTWVNRYIITPSLTGKDLGDVVLATVGEKIISDNPARTTAHAG